MRSCLKCGKELEDFATRCKYCGSTSITFSLEPAPAASAAKPPASAAAEPPMAGLSEPAAGLLSVFGDLNRAVMIAAVVVLAAGLGWAAWIAFRPPAAPAKAEERPANPNAVESKTVLQLRALIADVMAEKLAWGRDILKRRVPTRFPEELQIGQNEDNAEILYTNSAHTDVAYRLMVAYHYAEAREKSFAWTPVTFYFEYRKGQWVLIGDKWLKEWDVTFE